MELDSPPVPSLSFPPQDNTIQYADVGSFPGGGRPNVDALLAAYGWAKQNAVEHPEFASVVWGSA